MDFADIHNYFEPLVYEYVTDTLAKENTLTNEELLEDIACLALNMLPARYVRHDVDMAFFLTSREREYIRESVINAVEEAYTRICQREELSSASEA